MADLTFRANLKAAVFPFLSDTFGPSVIERGADQNYIGSLQADTQSASDIGIPQVLYCHNVIPYAAGYKSITYDQYVTPAYPASQQFKEVFVLRDGEGNSALMAYDYVNPRNINVYLLDAGSTAWRFKYTQSLGLLSNRVTSAYVSGTTYIFYEKAVLFYYTFATDTFSGTGMLGLNPYYIRGITGAFGYLIAYTEDTIHWSSTTDPIDFVPSLVTGAGAAKIEGLQGQIITVEPIQGGLIIYGADNAVIAIHTDNSRYPFTFVPLNGAGGLTDPTYVTKDVGIGVVYAYTESGFQQLTAKSANVIFPEVTDFLSGHLFEDFDEALNTLTLTDTTGSIIKKRIAFIADRYLIISYGRGELTHCLYYDTAYKQWGRLKIDHVQCFEMLTYADARKELPKKAIAFLTPDGGIKVLNSDLTAEGDGVFLTGKYQLTRQKWTQLLGVELENVNSGDTVTVKSYPSLDGKNFEDPVDGYEVSTAGKIKKYLFRNTAQSHTVLIKGSFNLSSIVLVLAPAGSR